MNLLPPGQIETKRFPIVGERVPSDDLVADPGAWELEVLGEVSNPFRMGLDEFREIATEVIEFDIHCVTSWSRFDSSFTGTPLAAVLQAARVDETAEFISFEAYSLRDHHTSLPIDVALADSWLVHTFDGVPLSSEHGGPVRVVTPGRYFYKSLKWLKRIVVLEQDRLGWWETNSSYHNNADPSTGEERFTTGSLRPEQLSRFLEAERYDKYRGRVMLGLDLRAWKPADTDLRRLYLKSCDLSGVSLAGLDLRESNLSLSDLRHADLSGSDLSGSDLEGANFSGADLRNADLSNTLLSATRFISEDGTRSKVAGMRIKGSQGLLEDQETFLRSAGVSPR